MVSGTSLEIKVKFSTRLGEIRIIEGSPFVSNENGLTLDKN